MELIRRLLSHDIGYRTFERLVSACGPKEPLPRGEWGLKLFQELLGHLQTALLQPDPLLNAQPEWPPSDPAKALRLARFWLKSLDAQQVSGTMSDRPLFGTTV